MSLNAKCPRCGYDLNRKWIDTKYVKQMLDSRPEDVVNLIKNTAKMIIDTIPSEKVRYKQFVYDIQASTDGDIDFGINKYWRGNYVNQGKGFAYLKWIIFNTEMNIESIKEMDIRKHGETPPYLEEG